MSNASRVERVCIVLVCALSGVGWQLVRVHAQAREPAALQSDAGMPNAAAVPEPAATDGPSAPSQDAAPEQAWAPEKSDPAAPPSVPLGAAAGMSSVQPPSKAAAPAPDHAIEIRVSGERAGSADDGYRARRATLGAFGDLSIKDTPYSLSATSSALWEHRQVHTEQDVLQTQPGVTSLMSSLAPGAGGMSRTLVRGGVMGDQGVLRDGLVDRGFTYAWFENVERVEVMAGLSSLLNGFGTTGGTMNLVSKRPTLRPTGSVAVGDYGGGIHYVTGDLSGPLPLFGSDRTHGRGIVHREDGSTFVNGSHERRTLLSTIVTQQLSDHVEVSADVAYQDFYARGLVNYIDVNPGKGIFVPSASRLDPHAQYGQDWNFIESQKLLVGAAGQARVSEVLSLRGAYRYGTMWRRYNTAFGSFTDNAGHYTEQFVTTPKQSETTGSAYALADVKLTTGPIRHTFTTGYNGTQFRYERGNDVKSDLGMSSLASPLVVPATPSYASGSANAQRTNYDSLILGDRAVWGPLSVLAGVNYALIRYKAWALTSQCTTAGQCPAGPGVTDTTQAALTPSIGVTLRPFDALALYASYMEGLVQGGTAPAAAANAYEVLTPTRNAQLELGAKWDLGRLQWTAALYRIRQINEFLDPGDNVYKQDGRQVSYGGDLTVMGQILHGLTAVGGVSLLHARVTHATKAELEDKAPINVPAVTGRLFLEYALPALHRVYLGAGANWNGKRYVDALNHDSFAASTTFDAGLRCEVRVLDHDLTAGVFVANLTDRRYWSYYRQGAGLMIGAPRTVSVSAKVGLW